MSVVQERTGKRMSKVSKEGKKKAGRKIIDTEAKNKRTAVSYTHLTLPTTPYV